MRTRLLANLTAGTLLTATSLIPAHAQSAELSRFGGGRVEVLTGYDVLRPGVDDDEDARYVDGLHKSVNRR